MTDAKPVAELSREAHVRRWYNFKYLPLSGKCKGVGPCSVCALADRAEAAERAAEWHQRERESAVGERDKALERLTAAERKRDDFKMQAEAQSDRNEDLQRERDEARSERYEACRQLGLLRQELDMLKGVPK